MNCVELRNMFTEKPRKYNHIEDYEYCKFLYENAKRRKSIEGSQSTIYAEDGKFDNIHMFLRDMEKSGAFDYETNYAYQEEDCSDVYWRNSRGSSWDDLLRARRQHRVHSSDNSDYSFWSLDATGTSRRSSTGSYQNNSFSETSNYTELLRLQSRYFYVQ